MRHPQRADTWAIPTGWWLRDAGTGNQWNVMTGVSAILTISRVSNIDWCLAATSAASSWICVRWRSVATRRKSASSTSDRRAWTENVAFCAWTSTSRR